MSAEYEKGGWNDILASGEGRRAASDASWVLCGKIRSMSGRSEALLSYLYPL